LFKLAYKFRASDAKYVGIKSACYLPMVAIERVKHTKK